MGLVSRIQKRDNGSLAYPPLWLRNFMLGIESPTASGVNVNPHTAVRLVAVYACVKVISESIAMLPLELYKRTATGKQIANMHPLYSILHDVANREITSFQFRQIMMVNALLTPAAYAEIEYNGAGEVAGLWPIPTNRVTVHRDATNGLSYIINMPSGEQVILPPDKMFVLPGMGFDTDHSFKPIELAREAIGLGLATEGMGARFFGNGANASGIVEYPGKMSDEAYTRFKQTFNDKFTGLTNANRVMFLEQGLKFTQLTIPPEAAQFLETRKFQTNEIARFFNVPPHMIMDLEHATFSNIEQQYFGYVTYGLTPWLVKWEQEIKRVLLTPKEQQKYFAKYSVDAILRGDFATRMAGYHLMINDGVFNADEVRDMEDINEQPDGVGKVYYQNGTMTAKGVTAPDAAEGGNNNEPKTNTPSDGTPNPDDPDTTKDSGDGGSTGSN